MKPALSIFALVLGCMFLAAAPAHAQERDPFRVTSQVDAPRGEGAEAYQSSSRRRGINTQAIYADGVTGNLGDGYAEFVPEEEGTNRNGTSIRVRSDSSSAFGVFFVIAIVIGLLLLWLKFGGSADLLSRKPEDLPKRQTAPEGWDQSAADADMGTESFLKMLASMEDRSEALVRMLRQCLLKAAGDTDTILARADTEREAFARIPDRWPHREALGALLKQTELAHYGGRDVSAENFEISLDIARRVLAGRSDRANA